MEKYLIASFVIIRDGEKCELGKDPGLPNVTQKVKILVLARSI